MFQTNQIRIYPLILAQVFFEEVVWSSGLYMFIWIYDTLKHEFKANDGVLSPVILDNGQVDGLALLTFVSC